MDMLFTRYPLDESNERIVYALQTNRLEQVFYPTEERVGHIAERQVEAGRSLNHGTAVGKSEEGVFAVVGTHTRVAYATERQAVIGDMYNGVV